MNGTITAGMTVPDTFQASWFRRIVKDHQVLRHPLLEAARRHELTKAQLKIFAIQESFVSLSFPAMLAETIAHVPYALEQVRYPLIVNMFEEVGERDLSQSHPSLLRSLAKGLGASDEEVVNSKPLPKTEAYLGMLFEICRGESYLRSLGAIGYGNEYLVLFEYPPFRDATRAVGGEDAILRFFDVNIEADAEHTVNLERTLAAACRGSGDVGQILDGMLQSLQARQVFYDGLWEEIHNGAN